MNHEKQHCHTACNSNKVDSTNIFYTCPMHPEVQQKGPGICPLCGMALEPVNSLKNTSNESEYAYMLTRFWVALVFSIPLFIINMGVHFTSSPWLHELYQSFAFNWVQLILSTPVVIGCGWPFFQRGWQSLVSKRLNMFTLIALGIGVAYVYSLVVTVIPGQLGVLLGKKIALDVYFEPAAMITTLVLLGQILELKERSQTNNAIQQLLDLTPSTATIIDENQLESEVSISQIKVGDLIRIKPGDKIPVDGVVVKGHSSIDQSMVTGESIEIEKSPGDFVIGGTLNATGSFIMKATKVGKDTMISQIVDMVSKAQRTKAPIQKLADQVSSYFVPFVLLVAFLTFISWYLLGPEPKIGYAILASVAVLIIACPCALGLATPMSIMVGMGRGAHEGVLIKNATTLETLAKINALVLDKTGTITQGKPSLLDVVCVDETYSKDKLLELAGSLEQNSEHPLAGAILQEAIRQDIPIHECSDFHSVTGKGITGKIQDLEIALGNSKFMESLNINMTFVERQVKTDMSFGRTIMFLAINSKLAGYLIVEDKIKSDASYVITELKKLGIQIFMLTGDNKQTANAIAKQVGITEIQAEVLPQHKFEMIKNLQDKGLIVAMAGDGINDAPALTQANVGIAMGNGTDIAMQSAGVVLIHGNLTGILNAIRLSNETLTNIKQNLFLAFIYNTIAIPIAAGLFYPLFGVLLSPVIASAAMAFSSVSVIFNALRLAKKSRVIS